MNKTKYRSFVIIFGIILLSVGVYIGFKITNDSMDDNIVNINNNDSNVEDYNNIDEKPVVSKNITNIEVVYKQYYKKCGETIVTSDIIYDKDLETLKKENSDYNIEEESENKIIFIKTNEGYCNNHFELKIVDNYVVIYQIINDGVSTIYKNTGICVDRIREEIKTELEKGIKINSIEELNSIIEDMES